MTFDTDTDTDSGAQTRSWLRRANDVRTSKPYRTGTMLASLALVAVIVMWAAFVACTSPDTAPGSPDGAGISTQPSAQPTPIPNGSLPEPQFAAPTSDRNGRRVEAPVNPLGQVLPVTPAGPGAADAATPPDGLMWQRVYGAILPFSTNAGPTEIGTNGVPAGYAHTAQGAVIAALQISGRLIAAPREHIRALIDSAIVIQSEGARSIAESALTLNLPEAQVAALFVVPMAVKVSNYADDYAQVSVAVRMPDIAAQKGIVASHDDFDMVWRDGTWKMVMPAAPTNRNTRLLTSLDPNWRSW